MADENEGKEDRVNTIVEEARKKIAVLRASRKELMGERKGLNARIAEINVSIAETRMKFSVSIADEREVKRQDDIAKAKERLAKLKAAKPEKKE